MSRLFRNGNYEECLKVLEQESKKDDVRYQLNLSLVRLKMKKCSVSDTIALWKKLENGKGAKYGQDPSMMGFNVDRELVGLRYNLAALLYRENEYGHAVMVLKLLWRNIEPMEDAMALNVCFLYMEVLMRCARGMELMDASYTYYVSKASSILNFAHRLVEKVNTVQDRYRYLLCKAKIALLQGNGKTIKTDIRAVMDMFQNEMEGKVDVMEMCSLIPWMSAVNAPGYLLKAQMCYGRKNDAKTTQLIVQAAAGVKNHIVFNNIACAQFQRKKYGMAQYYFMKALQAKDVFDGPNEECEMLYNAGLNYYCMKNFDMAFRCLASSTRKFHGIPYLWFRLGECCISIMANKKDDLQRKINKSNIVHQVLGSGHQRRVLLPVEHHGENSKFVHADGKVDIEPGTVPNYSYAVKCFRNVLILTKRLVAPPSPDAGKESEASKVANAKWQLLRQTAYANLAYVYLCLQEPRLAYVTARELLQLPSCSESNKYLANTYCSEALLMLSKSVEALEHLTSSVSVDAKELSLSICSGSYSAMPGVDAVSANAGVYINLATMYVLQGNFEQAEFFAKKAVSISADSPQVIKLYIYIMMKKGRHELALRTVTRGRVVSSPCE